MVENTKSIVKNLSSLLSGIGIRFSDGSSGNFEQLLQQTFGDNTGNNKNLPFVAFNLQALPGDRRPPQTGLTSDKTQTSTYLPLPAQAVLMDAKAMAAQAVRIGSKTGSNLSQIAATLQNPAQVTVKTAQPVTLQLNTDAPKGQASFRVESIFLPQIGKISLIPSGKAVNDNSVLLENNPAAEKSNRSNLLFVNDSGEILTVLEGYFTVQPGGPDVPAGRDNPGSPQITGSEFIPIAPVANQTNSFPEIPGIAMLSSPGQKNPVTIPNTMNQSPLNFNEIVGNPVSEKTAPAPQTGNENANVISQSIQDTQIPKNQANSQIEPSPLLQLNKGQGFSSNVTSPAENLPGLDNNPAAKNTNSEQTNSGQIRQSQNPVKPLTTNVTGVQPEPVFLNEQIGPEINLKAAAGQPQGTPIPVTGEKFAIPEPTVPLENPATALKAAIQPERVPAFGKTGIKTPDLNPFPKAPKMPDGNSSIAEVGYSEFSGTPDSLPAEVNSKDPQTVNIPADLKLSGSAGRTTSTQTILSGKTVSGNPAWASLPIVLNGEIAAGSPLEAPIGEFSAEQPIVQAGSELKTNRAETTGGPSPDKNIFQFSSPRPVPASNIGTPLFSGTIPANSLSTAGIQPLQKFWNWLNNQLLPALKEQGIQSEGQPLKMSQPLKETLVSSGNRPDTSQNLTPGLTNTVSLPEGPSSASLAGLNFREMLVNINRIKKKVTTPDKENSTSSTAKTNGVQTETKNIPPLKPVVNTDAGFIKTTVPATPTTPEKATSTAGNIQTQQSTETATPTAGNGANLSKLSFDQNLNREFANAAAQSGRASTTSIGHQAAKTVQLKPGQLPEFLQSSVRNLIKNFDLNLQPAVQNIYLQLEPENLGLVRIRLELKDNILRGQIESSRPEAVQILNRQQPQLINKLQDLGVQVRHLDVSLNQNMDARAGFSQAQQNNSQKNRYGLDKGNFNDSENIFDDQNLNIPKWLGYNTIDLMA